MPYRELVGGVHPHSLHPALQPRGASVAESGASPRTGDGGALYTPPGGGRRVGSGRGWGWLPGQGFCGKRHVCSVGGALRILEVRPLVQERHDFGIIVSSSR